MVARQGGGGGEELKSCDKLIQYMYDPTLKVSKKTKKNNKRENLQNKSAFRKKIKHNGKNI